jgi:hypothetical protein
VAGLVERRHRALMAGCACRIPIEVHDRHLPTRPQRPMRRLQHCLGCLELMEAVDREDRIDRATPSEGHRVVGLPRAGDHIARPLGPRPRGHVRPERRREIDRQHPALGPDSLAEGAQTAAGAGAHVRHRLAGGDAKRRPALVHLDRAGLVGALS